MFAAFLGVEVDLWDVYFDGIRVRSERTRRVCVRALYPTFFAVPCSTFLGVVADEDICRPFVSPIRFFADDDGGLVRCYGRNSVGTEVSVFPYLEDVRVEEIIFSEFSVGRLRGVRGFFEEVRVIY